MAKQKIFILTDSGTDVPEAFAHEHGIITVPLTIKFSDGVYYDKETIQPEEVYRRLSLETPQTSLPLMDRVLSAVEGIAAKGDAVLFCINISGALSGTANMMRVAAKEVPGLDCRFIDTKNIGIGAGLTVMRCAELIEQGMEPDRIELELNRLTSGTKVFFCIPTLEYLIKGGRVGRVSALMGTMLHIRPIITCGRDGVYQTVEKVRGELRSIRALAANAVEFAKGRVYHIAIAHSGAPELAARLEAMVQELIASAKSCVITDISPTLGVHTGPGLVGIGVQAVD